MNRGIEICRNCPNNYALEKTSSRIVLNVKRGNYQGVQIKSNISNMTQMAKLNGCPSQEIVRIKRDTKEKITQVDPELGNKISSSHIAIFPSRPDQSYGDNSHINQRKRPPRL